MKTKKVLVATVALAMFSANQSVYALNNIEAASPTRGGGGGDRGGDHGGGDRGDRGDRGGGDHGGGGGGPRPNPGPAPGPRPEPRPEPHPGPRPEPRPEPHPGPRPEPRPEPHPGPRPEPRPEPHPYPGPRPEPRPEPHPYPGPRPEPRPEPYPYPYPRPYPEPYPYPEPAPYPAPYPDRAEVRLNVFNQYHGGGIVDLRDLGAQMSRAYGRRLVSIVINSRRLSDSPVRPSIQTYFEGYTVATTWPDWDDSNQIIYVNQNNVLTPASALFLQLDGSIELNYVILQFDY